MDAGAEKKRAAGPTRGDKLYLALLRAAQRTVQALFPRATVRIHREGTEHRALLAGWLRGEGLEIGGLHSPLDVPPGAKVRYVDRLPVEELRAQYPELAGERLTPVDIVDDGERLATIADASQDFVIANSILEHFENPLRALENMFRVLKPGGFLYLAVPDKRHTYDADRPVTPWAHLLAEHRGSAPPRREHFEEWVRLVYKIADADAARARTDELMAQNYSIHFHCWTQLEILELLVGLRRELGLAFDVKMLYCGRPDEVAMVLQKWDQYMVSRQIQSTSTTWPAATS